MKKTTGVLLALLLSAGIAQAQDCKPTHEFETIEAGVLTSGIVTYMPYAGVAPDGLPTGVEGEVLKEIAKRQCLTIKTVAIDSAAAMNYIIGGRADIVSGGYYRTAERTKVVNLSDPIYVDQMAIISKDGIADFDTLKDKKLGVVQGDLWVADLKKLLGSNLKPYPAQPGLVNDLENGRLDAIILSFAVLADAQSKGQMKDFVAKVAPKDERVGASAAAGQGTYPMSKKNEAFTKMINDTLADLHKEGFIKEALEKYGLDPSASETGAPRLL
jgi:ABC-type amino acid transport/signal transduction systems, periplasmic component/domain